MDFFRERIDEHEKTFDENEESTNYVHAFLKEWRMRERDGEEHSFS
jgi:hypothetical protein